MLAHKTRPDNTLPTPCSSLAHSVALHALRATTHCWAPRVGSGFGAVANAIGRGHPKNGNAHAGCYGTSAPCMPMVASAPLPEQLPPGARHGHACSNPWYAPRLPRRSGMLARHQCPLPQWDASPVKGTHHGTAASAPAHACQTSQAQPMHAHHPRPHSPSRIIRLLNLPST